MLAAYNINKCRLDLVNKLATWRVGGFIGGFTGGFLAGLPVRGLAGPRVLAGFGPGI